MGSITRGLSNNITTSGVILPAGITNASVSAVTSFANASAGTLVLLSTQTASNSATISFTTGLDSTYDAYEFHFINVQPRTDEVNFTFNFSTDSGSNYNVTKTTSYFTSSHSEADDETPFAYKTNLDLAQSTAFQPIADRVGNGADECLSGILQLFNPTNVERVKHFICVTQSYLFANYSVNDYSAGYANTSSVVNAIQFKMASGNFDGIIKLYGLKKS
jgi:hypothetical protein